MGKHHGGQNWVYLHAPIYHTTIQIDANVTPRTSLSFPFRFVNLPITFAAMVDGDD